MEQTVITQGDIKEELVKLAPFHHNIELPHGLRTFLPELSQRQVEQTRLANLVKHAFPTLRQMFGGSFDGLRILDVACNCGGFSFEAAKSGADYVLGIDL
ncbi:MAG: methyltransferase type 12, partial [Okeania sp. SIO2D1]|nr:methyltransferase type 12 [Okeania sp. SIO2D1]